MSQVPPNFERSYSFTDFSVNTPNLQQPGNKIDQELNNARTSLNATIARLSEIQNDDGSLKISQSNINAANATAQASADAAEVSRLQAQAARNDTYTKAAEIDAAKTYVVNIANGMNASNTAALASIASSVNTVNGYIQVVSDYASAAQSAATAANESSVYAETYANQAGDFAGEASGYADNAAASAAAAAISAASAPAVPTGGDAGQVLTKLSGTDYQTYWANLTNTNSLQLTGGLMDQGALIDFASTNGNDSELGAWGLGVEDNTGHTATFEPQQIRIYDSTNPTGVAITSHGITFPDGSTMASSAVSVDLSGYLTKSSAASTYLSQSSAASVYAPISSPTFTGDPKAPTPATSDNDTSIATTAFVKAQAYAPLASPTFTGTPAAPTATTTDNSTKIATTAFVKSALSSNSASFYTQGKNITGATLPAFAVVYITGTNSNLPTWGLAKADSSATSDKTFGVLINAITNNGTGVAITAGMISNINTAAWTVGTSIWLSATTAGGLTSTRPSAPNQSVYSGIVITQNSSSGQIFVRIQNGYQLEDLHNVTITSPANNHSLFYNSATSTWVNRANDPGSGYLALTGGTMTGNINIGDYNYGANGIGYYYGDPTTDSLTFNTSGIAYSSNNGNISFNLNNTGVNGSIDNENNWSLGKGGVFCNDGSITFGLTKSGTSGDDWSLNASGVSGVATIGSDDYNWSFSGTGAATYGQVNIAYNGHQAQVASDYFYAYQTDNGTNPSAYGVVYTGGFEAADSTGKWIEFTPTQLRFGDGTIQTTAATGGGSGDYLPLAGGTMTGNIIFDGTSGQYIGKGTFDTSRGGNYGLSLVCSIGYELNWQAGWLTTTNQSSTTPRSLYLDSLAGTTLKAWDSSTDTGIDVSHTEITFADTTTQSTAGLPLTGGTMTGDIVLNNGGNLGEKENLITSNGTDGDTGTWTLNLATAGSGLTVTQANSEDGYNDIGRYGAGYMFLSEIVSGSSVSINATGITFPDSTVQTTAAAIFEDAPIDGNAYVRKNGEWVNILSL